MTKVVRSDEADRMILEIENERVRAFVRYGVTTALARRGMNPDVTSQADLDMYFLAEMFRSMGENHPAILRIFTGDISAMEWWPDDVGPEPTPR